MVDVQPRESVALRSDLLAVGAAAVLVALGTALGIHFNRPGSGVVIFAFAPPLYGDWLPRVGPGSLFAVVLAAAVVMWGPSLAERLSWRPLLALGYGVTVCWTMALALVDGFRTGFAGRLESDHEYLHEVPGITDIPVMLREFSSRILDFQPDSWTTHVSGHPPGATLVFVWLDRVGLGGGAWAATVCVLVGCLFAVAVPVTVRALGRPEAARAMLPFVALFPGVIWLGVSADGLFAGVTATGIALLALSRRRPPLALLAGVVLGFGIFLSYGLVLIGLIALAVVRSWRALGLALVGALAVVVVFALAGFWWLDGYHLVVERYYQGIASERPYGYWVWANLACLAIATGPALVAGVRRTVAGRWSDPVVLLGLAALLVVAFADLSGLSKAETERIWLPFAVWLLPAAALLPAPGRRGWLVAQAATALVVNHLVFTYW
ncbi:hypothetical protein JOM49_000417 [Amycolatopsis magusensis]|uniref:Integral membrane protein n=1 Tax=Amycolatopsis magusensis TaxID=882444 RepID=A0ABS4PHJ2_9PSEU|nr:hypothetical protein [Amycolatopsis magusensis]MBP2178891.1 hypothetical protein [Amycolatopsis magusensis]